MAFGLEKNRIIFIKKIFHLDFTTFKAKKKAFFRFFVKIRFFCFFVKLLESGITAFRR